MKKISNNQLKMLRELLHWRSKKEMHETMLDESINKLNESLVQCEKEEIQTYILNLVLSDKNGSGVMEIMEENGITLSD